MSVELKPVLVSGASGFLGQHLCQYLQDQQVPVLALSGRKTLDLAVPGLLLTEHLQTPLAQLPGLEQVVHLAGISGLDSFAEQPLEAWQVNLNSTLNLLHFARTQGCKRFLLLSTYVYGPPQYLPVDEQHPIQPGHPYHRSKWICEQLAAQMLADTPIELCIVRLFNAYGPGQSQQMLLPTIVSQLQQPELVLRDPYPRRDFVHVSDVVRALTLLLQRPAQAGVQVFNLGSGRSYAVSELVDKLLALSDSHAQVRYLHKVRSHELNEVVADIRKLQAVIDWQPEVELEVGLQSLLCAS